VRETPVATAASGATGKSENQSTDEIAAYAWRFAYRNILQPSLANEEKDMFRKPGLCVVVMMAALAICPLPQASADLVYTQTFTLPVSTLDIAGSAGTGTFHYWQDVAPVGATLTGVKLQISFSENMSSLSVTNTAANPNTFNYQTYTYIPVVGTAPSIDKAALSLNLLANGNGTYGYNENIDLYNTGNLLYAPGETKIFAPPPVFFTDDSTLLNAANINPYNTTGTFTLGFTTSTVQSAIGAGGNATESQTTDGSATVQVIYDYTVTPEPATLALLGLGGIALLARRFRRRKSQA